MKPILTCIIPVLLLTACDRPVQTVNLQCFDLNVRANIYSNNAKLAITRTRANTSDNFTRELPKDFADGTTKNVILEGYRLNVGEISSSVIFSGKYNDQGDTMQFRLWYDATEKSVESFGVSFGSDGLLYVCSVMVPYKLTPEKPEKLARVSKKKKAEIENCIEFITDNATVYFNQNNRIVEFEIKTPRGLVQINQEQALAISSNWDFDNVKLYTNIDDVLYEYELDACEVMDKIKSLFDK